MLVLLDDSMRRRRTEQKNALIALDLAPPTPCLVSYQRQASSCFTGTWTFWLCWPTIRRIGHDSWALFFQFFFYASMPMQVTNFNIEMYSCNHRVHRVANAAFWRTFSDEGKKIVSGWWGWGVHARPLSLHLPSPVKLQCTLQLSGQTH